MFQYNNTTMIILHMFNIIFFKGFAHDKCNYDYFCRFYNFLFLETHFFTKDNANTIIIFLNYNRSFTN